ncbi:MAG: bifunctional phosphoglucose/phosphomannose isomerase [Patescibacteria group bacterium]
MIVKNSNKNDMRKIDYSIDKSNLRRIIINSPNQLSWAISNWKLMIFKRKFSNVILCGMGGSAWPMEFVINYLTTNSSMRLSKIPIIIHRNYGLPDEAGKDSLMIFSSYSGNTEETIEAYRAAIKAGIKGVIITSGGKLESLAIQNRTPVLKIPEKNIPPRYSTGYMVVFLLKLLADAKIIKNASREISRTSEYLKNILANGKMEHQGHELAKKIGNKIVLIYSSVNYRIAAKVWKIKINENSKMPAFWNYMPEFNHNEMVGFTHANPKHFFVLILKDTEDNKDILKVLDISKMLLSRRGFFPEVINMTGDNFFSKVFSATLLCDWVSYYLALRNGIDPSPVPIVDEFKKDLKK